jgi:hypothetical protein
MKPSRMTSYGWNAAEFSFVYGRYYGTAHLGTRIAYVGGTNNINHQHTTR